MRYFLLLCGLLLTFMASAHARMHAGPVAMDGGRRLKGTTVQDGMATSLSAAYSFRKVRSAYAGSAVRLWRISDSAQLDIGFTAGGEFDTAAAGVHCPTACWIETWYDQSGNGRDLVRLAGSGPLYIASCGHGGPCARGNAAGQVIGTSAAPSWAATTSFSVVARRGAASAQCTLVRKGLNNLYGLSANQWHASDNVTGQNIAASDGAFHAGIAVIAGAGTVARIDTAEVAIGAIAGNVAAERIAAATGAAGTDCDVSEAFVWDNYALTLSERTALTANQIAYWTPLPLDSFATPAAAYSMRRLKSSYSGPAIRLRRASDNAEADIPFLGFTSFTGAPLDTAAAAAHCAATTCSVVTWYDQSGNARHATQATAGSQPPLVFNCQNGLPCMREAGFRFELGAGSITPASPVSTNGIARRFAGTGWTSPINLGSNYLFTHVADNWQLQGSSGAINMVATEGAWHTAACVLNGAASVCRLDAAETTATVTAATGAGPIQVAVGDAGASVDFAEAIVWSGYALTANERTALTANQRSFWGF